MATSQHPIMKIDQDGYLVTGGEIRIQDECFGHHLITHMRMTDEGLITTHDGQTILLQAFDRPLVAQMVERSSGNDLIVIGPYGARFESQISSLTLDTWDRFHGMTKSGLPFVLSRKAQNEFFNLLDEFEDDWVVWNGEKILTPSFYLEDDSAAQAEFWQDRYIQGTHAWDLGEPAPALVDALKTLKLTRQRVGVLGCGTGEDAAYFAAQGHLVTGYDFSSEALQMAEKKHGHVPGLTFAKLDVLNPPSQSHGRFDLLFDHAFFIALPPSRRGDLVKSYMKLLVPAGNLLGVYALFSHRGGPPFGLTEWELQQHLGEDFQHLYWSRKFQPRRGTDELTVYSQLKSKGS